MLKFIKNATKAIGKDLFQAVTREIDFYRVRLRTATLFLTYRCNSKCTTCTLWKKNWDAEIRNEISLNDWIKIIDDLDKHDINVLEIFGGNVLLRKDVLIPLCKYIKSKGMIIHIPTNQIGLDEECIKELTSIPIDFIYLSCDGPGKKQDKIRGIDGASNLAKNSVSLFKKYRGTAKQPVLICNTTVSKYNANCLSDMPQYAEEIGFDDIHFEYVGEMSEDHIKQSQVGDFTPEPYYIQQDGNSVLATLDQAKQIKEQLLQIQRRKNCLNIHAKTLNLDSLSVQEMAAGTIPQGKCYVERNEITIDPSGRQIPCPAIINYIIGDVLTDGLEGTWNNKEHQRFRALQNTGTFEICKHCILGVQRNPSFLKSLKRIYFFRIEDRLLT